MFIECNGVYMELDGCSSVLLDFVNLVGFIMV